MKKMRRSNKLVRRNCPGSVRAQEAVPVNENITRPRLIDEKSKRREEFQNSIQSESKCIQFKLSHVYLIGKITVCDG